MKSANPYSIPFILISFHLLFHYPHITPTWRAASHSASPRASEGTLQEEAAVKLIPGENFEVYGSGIVLSSGVRDCVQRNGSFSKSAAAQIHESNWLSIIGNVLLSQ